MKILSTIRPAVASDLDAIYAISLATGHKGADATSLYNDPNLIGHIYAAPYVHFSPELCFVVQDNEGVAGFIVGTADTEHFAETLEQKWWPELRKIHPDPVGVSPENQSPDQNRAAMIHHPKFAPETIVRSHPAHIHMNLLQRLQGQGIGSQLLQHWIGTARKHGVSRVHLGANINNTGGVSFWKKSGFSVFDGFSELPDTVLMGCDI